jgi:hypothetical protein
VPEELPDDEELAVDEEDEEDEESPPDFEDDEEDSVEDGEDGLPSFDPLSLSLDPFSFGEDGAPDEPLLRLSVL